MENSTVAWLVKWFAENNGDEESEILNGVNDSYFEKGWMDSLKFINFITDIEEAFSIEFSNEEFQDRSFATIQGISQIIERKMGQK